MDQRQQLIGKPHLQEIRIEPMRVQQYSNSQSQQYPQQEEAENRHSYPQIVPYSGSSSMPVNMQPLIVSQYPNMLASADTFKAQDNSDSTKDQTTEKANESEN